MKYQKPKCDCGNDLRITAIVTCDRINEITNDGTKSKNTQYTPESVDGEHLECTICGCSFEIEIDKKGRYFRGETYKPW